MKSQGKGVGRELDLAAILERVARVAGVRSDSDVARALAMTPQGLASAKLRGSIPYARLITFAERNDIALEHLFWGSGPPKRLSGEIDPELLALVGAALADKLPARRPIPGTTRDLCAAMIYNDVSSVPEAQRADALERSVRRVVQLLKSLGALKVDLDEPFAIAAKRARAVDEKLGVIAPLPLAGSSTTKPRRRRI